MKKNLSIFVSFTFVLYATFFITINIFDYFDVATYKKEIALIIGIVLSALELFFISSRDSSLKAMFKIQEKFPIWFFISILGSFLLLFMIYQEFMKG